MCKKVTAITIVSLIFLMSGLSTPATARTADLASILQPAPDQKLAGVPVEIVVHLDDGLPLTGFRARLNQRDITSKFEWNGQTGRALVGPKDGLNVYSEKLETTRDDQGVWFIRSKSPNHHRGKRGQNVFRIRVRDGKHIKVKDRRRFIVDNAVEQVFTAMGYAVATDRLWQMELYRRSARGTLAEVLGPDQLETDVFMRTIGYSKEELQTGFVAQEEESRALLRGYVAGINKRITEIREDVTQLPFEFAALRYVPTDWSVLDVLAWGALLQRNFDPEALDQSQLQNAGLLQYLQTVFPATSLAMFNDLRWTNDPEAQTMIIDEVAPTALQPEADEDGLRPLDLPPQMQDVWRQMKQRKERIHQNLKKINAKVKMGSYAWALSGKKTTSGRPIIYSGPQMGFSVPSIVTEGSIQAAGINISGMTVPGIPGIIIGRTPHHAWSMQVGPRPQHGLLFRASGRGQF